MLERSICSPLSLSPSRNTFDNVQIPRSRRPKVAAEKKLLDDKFNTGKNETMGGKKKRKSATIVEEKEEISPAAGDPPRGKKRRSIRDDEEDEAQVEQDDDGNEHGGGEKEQEQDGNNHNVTNFGEECTSKSVVNGSPTRSRHSLTRIASPIFERHRNAAGVQAEAGIIKRIQVENFMCHRKLTVDLCRNVNFIHGQNGSGKSAILAAIQICLGAGARRTHRAKNLKDLIRKGYGADASCTTAKVRVTLLNHGEDAFEHEKYGDEIIVERCITTGSGYNGYKLYSSTGGAGGKEKEISRLKKDLDNMLDCLNVQVENPVAVLDQEEAKKFLMGKAEDKYNFFMKATELERLDRSYASIKDNITDLEEKNNRIRASLETSAEYVKKLDKEWKEYQELNKLEDKIAEYRAQYAWALVSHTEGKINVREQALMELEAKIERQREKMTESTGGLEAATARESQLKEQLNELSLEAEEAAATKNKIESEIRQHLAPVRIQKEQLNSVKREYVLAERRLASARKYLQEYRDQIAQKYGSVHSEEARRTKRIEEAEEELASHRSSLDERKRQLQVYHDEYEETEPHVEQATNNLNGVTAHFLAVSRRVADLKSCDGNSIAVFGQKCVSVLQKVEEAKKCGRFRGPVVGPIGAFLKIVSGKEHLAKIAESALGGGLDRFIVTNDNDRRELQNIRRATGCSSRDCNIFQCPEAKRYNVPAPPCDGIETVASTLNICDDLVYNCLVDNMRIDQLALAMNKEESEELLLVQDNNGKETMRWPEIQRVFFLPRGDYWHCKGGYRTMTSSDNRQGLRQTIGVDRTAAINEASREKDSLQQEVDESKRKEKEAKERMKIAQRNWNEENHAISKVTKRIQTLEREIDDLKAEMESAQLPTEDTSELEDEVATAEESLTLLRAKRAELERVSNQGNPELESARRQHEEVTSRNEKIVADMYATESAMIENSRAIQSEHQSARKRIEKLAQMHDVNQSLIQEIDDERERKSDSLAKARLLTLKLQRQLLTEKGSDENLCDGMSFTQEELDAVEPIQVNKEPDYFKAKIERAQKQLDRERSKRQIIEVDGSVLYEKLKRAKADLHVKLSQIDSIDGNVNSLVSDLKARKDRWMNFRKHIAEMTSNTFDDMLNKKGSSGEIVFDHDDKTLNLVVQKDNSNANTQTNDVKALSGGERSFTTLSLLLALGENLETPFRVMDEFDVFLDAVSRRIALKTMVEISKAMVNRQFIFITPQDLSSLKPDNMLKIIVMKAPDRGTGQQIIDFEQS